MWKVIDLEPNGDEIIMETMRKSEREYQYIPYKKIQRY